MTKRQQQIQKYIMHTNTLLMGVGYFMLIPILGNFVVNVQGLAASLLGYITGVRFLSQDMASIFCGVLADKIGNKKGMLIGAAIRGSGMFLFGFMTNFVGYMFASFFVGLGGALFMPSCYGYYDMMATSETRASLFTMRETLNNFGSIVGPMVGGLMYQMMDFQAVCFTAAAVYAIAITVTAILLPALKEKEAAKLSERQSFLDTAKVCLKNKEYLVFLMITGFITGVTMQIDTTIPVRISLIDPEYPNVSMIYTVAAIIGVVIQYPLIRYISPRIKHMKSLAISCVILCGGLVVAGWANQIWMLYVGTMIFTFGKMIYQPIRNLQVTEFAEPGKMSSYYGFQGISFTLGTVMASFVTGWMYDVIDRPGLTYLPWLFWCSISLICAAAFIALYKYSQNNKEKHHA